MAFNPKKSIWTERYRPTKVSEMVGDFRDKILKYLDDPNAIPHFLFHSNAPGTGKTTLAKCIINELDCDALILNSSDDRKIEVVRDKVKQFAITRSSKQGKRRCVFLDEFDGMLKASQDALRNLMETYSSNCFFILTCNNLNKVIEPLKSRCKIIKFAYPNKEEISAYLKMICANEDMNCTDDGIVKLIELNYPSIRNCVITLQDLKVEQKDVTVETVKPHDEVYETLWKKLKAKDWFYIKEAVLQTTVNPRELNTYFWKKALISEPINLKIIQITCRNEKDIAWGADEKIIIITSLIEMCK